MSKELRITSFTCAASEGGQCATMLNNSSPVKSLFTSLQARTNVLRSTVSYKNNVINNEFVYYLIYTAEEFIHLETVAPS